jgi:hypothetical protein
MSRWFRWHEGTCEDGKFRVVARNAGVTVATVMGVWAILLEDASHDDHRGIAVRGEDFYAAILDLGGELQPILEAMQNIGLIACCTNDTIEISNWSKRQYETDTTDATNAERQRRFREKHKSNGTQTKRNGSVTAAKRPDTEADTDTDTDKIAASPPTRAVSEKSRKANSTPLPDSYSLPERVALFGATQGLSDAEMNREHQRFCNHAKQNDRRCVDWIAAERNWMIGAAEKLGKSPRPTGEQAAPAGFYAKFGSEEQDAWDAYGKAKAGKPFPRDSKGGWRHPTQWPPGYVPLSQTQGSPPAPILKSM